MNLQILEKNHLGKETEAILVKDKIYDQTIYQVSICIKRLEKLYYENQLYQIFTDLDEAQDFYQKLCEMREQDE